MANRSVILSFLLILCMSSNLAHCSLLDGNLVDPNTIRDITGIDQVISISGVVDCLLPPPQLSEPSLPAGINVVLTCDGGRTVISEAVTDTKGFFQITLNTIATSLFRPNQCDACRIVVRESSLGSCVVYPGHRGALLAPVNCRHPIVDRPDGHDYGHGKNVVQYYKAERFYFDPSHNYNY